MKKYIITNTFIVLGILVIGAISCTDNFSSLNTPEDEIALENVDVGLLGQAFARAQFTTYFGLNSNAYQRAESHYGHNFSQYFATIHPNFTADQYVENPIHLPLVFNYFYNNVSAQLKFVEDFTAENSMPAQNAIAKVWRVQAYHRMTDHWGPIIYSEYGNAETSVPYDSQEYMYDDFFKTLDEAIPVLEQHAGQNVFGTHDQMFQGDVDKWITYANSLRLRLAMRIVYADETRAQQEAEKAAAAGVIQDNSETAQLATTINSENTTSQITYHDEFRVGAALYSALAGYDDPRLSVYMDEIWDGGGYKGLRNGLPAAQKDRSFLTNNYSALGIRWRPLFSGPWGEAGTNEPVRVLSTAETYFLRAEGALRGWDMGGGTAQEYYNEGIRASLSEDRVNASEQVIEDYIVSTNTPAAIDDPWGSPPMSDITVAYNDGAGFEKQLEQIITQKWLAGYPDGFEAWAERRRTGYPVGYALIASLNPNISEVELFRRIPYPSNEKINNPQALEDAIQLLDGGDVSHARLWWDKKPLADYPVPTQ